MSLADLTIRIGELPKVRLLIVELEGLHRVLVAEGSPSAAYLARILQRFAR